MPIYFKYFFLLLLLLVLRISNGQNLIPNPSFENYTICPGASSFYRVTFWCGLGGLEDCYNTCNPGPGGPSIPYASQGFQYAKTGNSMGSTALIAIGAGGQNKREYLYVPLTEALKSGKIYCGKLHINLANECRYTTDRIGMYFSLSLIHICI